jgi:hypothetical protein
MLEVEKDEDHTAFREGLFVRALGRPLKSNPYAPGSTDERLWAEGWRLIDTPRNNIAQYVSPPTIVPPAAFIPTGPTMLSQERLTRIDAPPLGSFSIYLAVAFVLGGFLLMMLASIERLGG